MQTLAQLSTEQKSIFTSTKYKTINLNEEEEIENACEWWEQHTNSGGEGFVIKPLNFIERKKGSIIQAALKTRGASYLRIIYGPNYDMPDNLHRLRQRGLSRKRALAEREFSLGVEALERFIKREPLYRVHECVFAILALESDPVDPRL